MRLHGSRRDAQLVRDLLVREALRDELDDLPLAIRERRCSLRQRLVHAAELTTCCTRATFIERRIWVVYSRGLANDPLAGGDEARFVASPIGFFELVLRQRADAPQELELVPEVRPHHLRAVGGDREADLVLDEAA